MFNKIIRFITHIKTFVNIIYFLFSVSNQIPSFLPTVIPVWPVLIAYEDYLFNYSNPAQDINTVFGLDINHHADTDSDTPTFRTPNIYYRILMLNAETLLYQEISYHNITQGDSREELVLVDLKDYSLPATIHA